MGMSASSGCKMKLFISSMIVMSQKLILITQKHILDMNILRFF